MAEEPLRHNTLDAEAGTTAEEDDQIEEQIEAEHRKMETAPALTPQQKAAATRAANLKR
jgi:hypothetical protein